MSVEVDVVIVGAGVVGLAVAARISKQGRRVIVFEKNRSFGCEISSRNSEVIHAGIYYPQDSLKARLCIEGNRLLYELCEKNGIPCRKTGKIIVAVNDDEIEALNIIHEQASRNGVEDLEFISGAEINKREPNIKAKEGLFSPSTGIIDTHALMRYYYQKAVEGGADILFESTVERIEKPGNLWKVKVRDWNGVTDIDTRVVVNSAGLQSDVIARLAGVDVETQGYRINYCKGEYFGLGSKWRNAVNTLIYPPPEKSGLGIHVTISRDGMVRLGPNAEYVDSIEYDVNINHKKTFFNSAMRFMPQLEIEDLHPDFAGIRPRLQVPGGEFRDFVIAHEEISGLPGLINLVGIESPGLTASPAIGKYVADITSRVLS
ncbi:MAG: NAD(P)/FAD-dependent oxidoreductase [Dehalococcoidia bacterium]